MDFFLVSMSVSAWISIFMVLVAVVGLPVLSIIRSKFVTPPKGLRRPPSPKGARFLTGHTHLWSGSASSNPSQTKLVQWAEELGEIYEIQLGSERWVILSSPEAVKEVFDQHGALTGSRPPMPVAMDILSGGYRMLFMPYGKKWRSLRAIVHRCLTAKSADAMKPSQSLESHQYLKDILAEPENFMDHVKRYTSSVIMYSTFGRRVLDLNDPVLQAIYQETAVFSDTVATRFLVDQYPFLTKLPKRLQWWRRKYEAYHQKEADLWLGLWKSLKSQVASGNRTGCFAERLLEEDYPALGISEIQAAYVAGSMIEAGSDTTQLTMNNLILGLVAFPEVMVKAQEEIDAVTGDRMPTFEDLPAMPYVRAMVKEVLRWRSVSNDHIRHVTTGDVAYKDYFIPAGSTVVLNQWALHYDPALYPEPQRFNPDRFLGTPTNDMTAGQCINTNNLALRDHWSFGAGRRVCAGYHLAENSLHILSARLLWAFDMKPPLDHKTGQPYKYDLWNYAPTRLFGPNSFPVEFKVRSEQKRLVILGQS